MNAEFVIHKPVTDTWKNFVQYLLNIFDITVQADSTRVICVKEELTVYSLDMSLAYIRNNEGPKIDPCGLPQ